MTYSVVARNFSEASDNKIHSDEIARKAHTDPARATNPRPADVSAIRDLVAASLTAAR